MDFSEYFDVLEDDEFEERPVDLETFVYGKGYLGLPPLSHEQLLLVRAMTQIYKEETLVNLYGPKKAAEIFDKTVNEVVAQLGKGSGKDYCSTIAVAYVVYQLLCLKDPSAYYGKSSGDAIHILNIAINAEQAKNVFFRGFKRLIDNSPWFEGRYEPSNLAIEFDKNITCYSGHSEKESWEGYNVFMAILDEIAGFASETTTGQKHNKSARDIYEMYSGSVVSRFPEFGKTVLLSFPRYKGDFIQTRYDEVVGIVEPLRKVMRLKIIDKLPDEIEDNWFEFEYDHDNIVSYKVDRVFALKRATWEVNPTWDITKAKGKFIENIVDALSRFACMPPDAVDAFFKSREKVEAAFTRPNPFDEQWRFHESFIPDKTKTYYIHVDLAQKHDRAAVALAHVHEWANIKIAENYSEPQPIVRVDAVRYWTPKADQEIDFGDIRSYIISLRQRGFNIGMVTFDRWNSIDTIKFLQDNGMEADRLSVDKRHYEDLQLTIQEERLKGPNIELLITELLQLKIIRGNKVDHPREGSKDLSDAVAGAVYNAIAYTERNKGDKIIEIESLETMRVQTNFLEKPKPGINPPSVKKKAPDDISDFLARIRML